MNTILLSASDAVQNALDINFTRLILDLILIMVAVVTFIELLGKFSKCIGKPFKWVRKNDKDHEDIVNLKKKLTDTENCIAELKRAHDESVKASIRHDKQIEEDLKDLKNMVIEDRVMRMRNVILDTASAITNNQIVTREQYDNALRTYDDYDKFIRERGLTNGRAEVSISIIREKYTEVLKQSMRSKDHEED